MSSDVFGDVGCALIAGVPRRFQQASSANGDVACTDCPACKCADG